MIGFFSSRAVAVCAALALAVSIKASAAQDFLSPQPLIQNPFHQKRPPRRSRTVRRRKVASRAAVGGVVAKPDVSEEIGSWRLLCFRKPSRVCKLSQRRINPKNRALLIWVELTHALKPKPDWQMAVMLPLGLRLAPDLGIHADDGVLIDLPIVTCIRRGCVYSAQMPIVGLETLETSRILGTEVTDLAGHRYSLKLSMGGFNQAYLKSALVLKEK